MMIVKEEDRILKGRVYLLLLPLITLSASVWFTQTKVGVVLALIFTGYIYFLGFTFSSYLWSLNHNLKNKSLNLFSIQVFLISLIGLLYSIFFLSINFLIPISFILFYYLNRKNKTFMTLFPLWLKDFAYRLGVMVFICLMNVLAFWFNPYSQPIKYFLNEF